MNLAQLKKAKKGKTYMNEKYLPEDLFSDDWLFISRNKAKSGCITSKKLGIDICLGLWFKKNLNYFGFELIESSKAITITSLGIVTQDNYDVINDLFTEAKRDRLKKNDIESFSVFETFENERFLIIDQDVKIFGNIELGFNSGKYDLNDISSNDFIETTNYVNCIKLDDSNRVKENEITSVKRTDLYFRSKVYLTLSELGTLYESMFLNFQLFKTAYIINFENIIDIYYSNGVHLTPLVEYKSNGYKLLKDNDSGDIFKLKEWSNGNKEFTKCEISLGELKLFDDDKLFFQSEKVLKKSKHESIVLSNLEKP